MLYCIPLYYRVKEEIQPIFDLQKHSCSVLIRRLLSRINTPAEVEMAKKELNDDIVIKQEKDAFRI